MPTATITTLDAIRYLLASIVLLGHAYGFFFHAHRDGPGSGLPPAQSIAVVGFFYLSGFLICYSALKAKGTRRASLERYLFDRSTRIYLTLLPCLLFVWIVDVLLTKQLLGWEFQYESNTSSGHLIKNLLLIPSMPFAGMRPIWSLMYEWWLYILFGAALFLRSRPIISSLLLLAALHYTLRVNARGEAGNIWLIWFYGACCAWLWHQRKLIDIPPVFLPAIALCTGAVSLSQYRTTGNAYDLIAGLFGSTCVFAILLWSRHWSGAGVPSQKFWARLAGFSFTLFLIHYSVLIFVRDGLGLVSWWGFAVGVLASNMSAYLIAAPTEMRLDAWRRLFAHLLRRPELAGRDQ